MDSALTPAPAPLDIKTLLARVNQRIALLRAWISHDHGDEPYWWARRTLADDWYQVTFSSPMILQLARGTSAPTKKCPDHLRHWVQWHASGGFRSPVTSIRTAPHMHEALRMARALSRAAALCL